VDLLVIAIAGLIASAMATKAMIPWLAKQGAVATENERTMHAGSVPKGGGLPLLLSALAALTALTSIIGLSAPVIAGAALLAYVSWRDDLAPVPATIRFLAHVAASCLFVFMLPDEALVFQGLLPWTLDRLLAVVALTWMINLYNFMDGINGIAGAETLAITSGYLLIAHSTMQAGSGLSYSLMAAVLFGATVGFMIWNARAKALVFLGDVGSVPLGFLMGVLLIDLAVKGQWAAALILPAIFVTDAKITLLTRLLKGAKPWQAHKEHFYQRAAAALGSHLAVVWRVAVANLFLIAAAFWSLSSPWPALAATLFIVALLLWHFDRVKR
jgi:UDP-N-acetylmuramyl pentapeptide phosphotransferase/UDP-N-acetylglucosamine-1-phosphate transferase